MKSKYIHILFLCLLMSVIFAPNCKAEEPEMADYTAYPPFVTTGVIEPNILLLLDHSGSMQFPAYLECDFQGYDNKRADCGTSDSLTDVNNRYKQNDEYYGYFKTDKYYQDTGNKFEENAACPVYVLGDPKYKIGDNSGTCISGNLLNWATMSRIDLMRKVLIGGKSTSTQLNAHTLRAEGGWWTFSDHNLGCTFNMSGGSYPNIDHDITISNYNNLGTCGYLSAWAGGTGIWGTSDHFRYIHQPINGDFDVKLKIVSPPTEAAQDYSKAGLMVRASTNSNSQHVMISATNSSGLQFAYRSTDGGSTTTFGSGYVATAYPVWVRMTRVGDVFTSFYSADGAIWTQDGTVTVALPANALIGMNTASYSSSILGKAEYDEFICDVCNDDDFNDEVVNAVWTAEDISTSVAGSQTESCNTTCMIGTLAAAETKVDVPENERKGIIHSLADKDYDGTWDADSPRFGLMTFAGDDRLGEIKVGIEGANMSSFLTAIQSEPPYSTTPTGEALYEAYDYYKQIDDHPYEDNNAYIGGQGSVKDPLYDGGSALSCRDNFILLISDGEWNGADNPLYPIPVDPVVPARENWVNDIRLDIDGVQTIATYSVMAFSKAGAGRNSLQQTALYGGFDDYDGNTWPYNRTAYPADSRNAWLPASPCLNGSLDGKCSEWDKDTDGYPDNYYEAQNGSMLEATLLEAIADILKKASSGTAVSVLATTGEGEGSIYQAYFFPEKLEGVERRKWLGYIQSIFVDKYGNLREDTDSNDALDLAADLIIEMQYSSDMGTTVNKFSDFDADGVKDSAIPVTTVPLDNVTAIWKGGESLWEANPINRTILTSIDGFNTLDFSTVNSAVLSPYIRAADASESDNIINWTRGDDLTGVTDLGHATGYRERSITIDGVTNVWKLGDIVFSTPTVVGRPVENYDMLYEDASYAQYRNTHKKRRQVVYAGANDGMLHAFNGGCFDEDQHAYYPDVDIAGNCVNGGHTLGQELWSFIPRGLLPHLKWNTMPDYTHVYHVDLKPKIADVPAFTADANHTNGWGTILISGFRYGGKAISWTAGAANYSASPEYFAMDITDPLNPRLLWTFSDPDLGLSMSYPAGVKVDNKGYLIFGSGATNYDSASNLTTFQDGYVYVLDLTAGANGVISNWIENTNFWKIPTGNNTAFMADPVSVDVDIDYDVDVMYIGENYFAGNKWNSLLKRITTNKGVEIDPTQWVISTIANANSISGNDDVSKKITSAPSVAMDDRANLWTFFGTGQFYGTSDKNQTDAGAFYAIKDQCWNGTCTDSYTNVMDISGATVKTDATVTGLAGGCSAGVATWSSLINASSSCDGWVMNFANLGEAVDFSGNALTHNGERMLSKPLVLGGLVTFATYIPGIDACAAEGQSNVYAVYYKTGTAYSDYVFKDQKEQAISSDEVARVAELGVGLPSSMSAQITASGTAKGFVQQSTGSILEIENITPISLKSGVTGWKNEEIQ